MAVDPFECYRGKVRKGTIPKHMLDEMEGLRDTITRNGNEPDQIAVAQRVLEQMQRRVEQRKIQTGLQFLRFQDAASRMDTAVPRTSIAGRAIGGAEAASSMLVRDNRGVYKGANVEAHSHAIQGMAHSLFRTGLEKLRRKGLGLIDSPSQKALQLDVLRALYGDNGVPAAAAGIADAWRATDHYLIGELRRGGADIVERRDWRIPQRHEKMAFRTASSKVGAVRADHLAEWKSFILDKLDRSAMISRTTGAAMDDVELDQLLDDMFDNVYTDGLNKFEKAKTGSAGGKRPRRLADRHTMERVIVFRSADDQMAYNERFGGNHDLFSMMTGHIDKRAREAAFLQILGPDPDATIDLLGKRALAFDGREPASMRGMYNELSGRLETPDGETLAGVARGIRNVLTAAQLGGAMLSAISDVSFQALEASYVGLSTSKVLSNQMHAFIRGAYSTEDTDFALRLGLIAEEWSGSALAAARYTGEMNGPRITRKWTDAVMRASFLSQWTQSGRHAFQVEFLGHLAAMADKTFDEIIPETRRALEARNFTAADWDAVRAVPGLTRGGDATGPKYMSAPALFQAGLRDEAMKIMQVIHEEVEFAVPSSSARTRAALKGAFGGMEGTQAGTWTGELMRFGGMYKSFSVTLAHTHLSRYLLSDMALSSRAGYMAAMVIGTSIMGGIALNAKQIAAGKDPIDPFGDHSSKFWRAAMLQGGGLGLFGDYLFADYSRFGKSLAMSAAGPGASLLDDLAKLSLGDVPAAIFSDKSTLGRDAVRFVGDYAPGGNLWYARLAFERGIIDQLQYLADPDASKSFRNKANRARRDFGAGYWWAPGRTSPDRAPKVPKSIEEAMGSQ